MRVYGAGANAEMEKLKRSLEELRQENLELKQRLNDFTLSNDQVQEQLECIRKLEEKVE